MLEFIIYYLFQYQAQIGYFPFNFLPTSHVLLLSLLTFGIGYNPCGINAKKAFFAIFYRDRQMLFLLPNISLCDISTDKWLVFVVCHINSFYLWRLII